MHNSLLHLLLKNGDFLNTDISPGSVATRLGCGGVFVYDFVYKFITESNSERILKIGQYLVKLWARVWCLVFLTHCVVRYNTISCSNVRSYTSPKPTDRTNPKKWGKALKIKTNMLRGNANSPGSPWKQS